MKFSTKIISWPLFFLQTIFCENYDDFNAGVRVLLDIIDVYFVKDHSSFDIYIHEPVSLANQLVINEVLSRNNDEFSYRFRLISNYTSDKYFILDRPTIIVVSRGEELYQTYV